MNLAWILWPAKREIDDLVRTAYFLAEDEKRRIRTYTIMKNPNCTTSHKTDVGHANFTMVCHLGGEYLSLVLKCFNPMQNRIWSDGRLNKLTIAQRFLLLAVNAAFVSVPTLDL